MLCPDAGVLKTAKADPISATDPASFDVVVSASGTGPSENVVLSDLNDTGHAWTISGADASACTDLTVAADETLTCTWASIPTGQSRTITITMTSDADDCANGIENTATIASDADTNEENNSSQDSIEVLCPDLELEKSGSDPVSAGDDVTFTLKVTNHGEGDAKNVVLTDNLPDDGLSIWVIKGTVGIDAADRGIDPRRPHLLGRLACRGCVVQRDRGRDALHPGMLARASRTTRRSWPWNEPL